jgi:branched-chain amino acid transport system permease protein
VLTALDAVVQGMMLGAIYTLFALGLSLMFGVMRLVNTAHGDFVILAAFLSIAVTSTSGLSPFASLAITVPLCFALGYGLQRGILNPLIGRDALPSIVVTFGISILIQNGLMEIASADTRSIGAQGLEVASVPLGGGLAVGGLSLLILAVSLLATAGFDWMMRSTRIGKAFRAISDDAQTAALMGIDARHLFALATGIALGLLGVAGVLLAMRTSIAPSDGPAQLIFAFEAVVIGGLGSFWGTFAGALVLGLAQSIGSRIDPGWGALVGHLVFLAVLLMKPLGLFPMTR